VLSAVEAVEDADIVEDAEAVEDAEDVDVVPQMVNVATLLM